MWNVEAERISNGNEQFIWVCVKQQQEVSNFATFEQLLMTKRRLLLTAFAKIGLKPLSTKGWFFGALKDLKLKHF